MLNFFQHMEITDRVKAGQATQEDAAALLAEVDLLRRQRNALSGKLVNAYGLVKTTMLASQEAFDVLEKELQWMNAHMHAETSTD